MKFAALLLLSVPAIAAADLSLDGLTHVALRVGDVAASRAFYEKLGFEQSFEFTDAKGVTTSYMKVNDRQFIELYRRNSPAEPLGLMHLCFDTSGLDALFDAYVAGGLKPTDRRKARAGNLLFNLRDPEGQLIEYTQYLPGSMHSNDRGQHLGEQRVSTHLIGAAVPVKDIETLRVFFKEKLGFTDRQGRLILPGKSGEEIELDSASATWKPRLIFEVPDARRAEAELKKRGISAENLRITDPDGNVVVFRIAAK